MEDVIVTDNDLPDESDDFSCFLTVLKKFG